MSSIRCLARLMLALAAASCASGKEAARPDVDAAPRLVDAGARLWSWQAPPGQVGRLRLEVWNAADDVDTRASCPGPFRACAERRPAWNGELSLSLIDERYHHGGSCELKAMPSVVGTHVCGGVNEGQQVTFELVGDDLRLRLDGNPALPSRAISVTDEFLLRRLDPMELAFEAARGGRNRSQETRHLALLTAPLEQASAGFASPEAVRATIVELGIDPQTVPIARLRRVVDAVDKVAMYATMRLPAPEQAAFRKEIVEEIFVKTKAPKLEGPSESSEESVVLEPGDGSFPPAGATVGLRYLVKDRDGAELEYVKMLVARLEQLAPEWRSVIEKMSKGETRRWWPSDAEGGAIVDVTLERFGLFPETPRLQPPADAETAPNGLRYVVLHREPDGARPKPDDEIQVHHTSWNAAGRILATTAWEGPKVWASLSLVGDSSLTVAAAHLLRVGERGRFWIPEEHESRKDSRRPFDEPAVFEVELLGVD